MKRGLGKEAIFAAYLCCLFALGISSATNVTIAPYNSTHSSILISEASDLCAYEVNFESNATLARTVTFTSSGKFLGSVSSGISIGNSTNPDGGGPAVYESKLDSSRSGVNGSGVAFNVSYSGDLILRYAAFVYSNGTEEYVYYNQSGEVVIVPGSAPTGGSSGGGGGGSSAPGIKREDISLYFKENGLNINAIVGKLSERKISIFNNGTAEVRAVFVVDGLEEIISSEELINIKAGEEKEITLKVNPVQRGLLTGKIALEVGGSRVAEMPVVINAKTENFLFDVAIVLTPRYQSILMGQKMRAQVILKEVGKLNENVDVTITYMIKDFEGHEFYKESETFAVKGEKEYVKEFDTSSLMLGKYIVGIEVVYPGAFATSSAQFEVVESKAWEIFTYKNLILLLVIWGVIAVSVVFWSIVRKR